jgi:predicted aspartyl protease
MKIVIKFDVINLEGDGFHLNIRGNANGIDVNLIIDTGASKTVFDINTIKEVLQQEALNEIDKLSSGLGTNTMKSFKTTIEKFELDGFEELNYEVAVLDLTHVNLSYENIGLSPIDGIIGGDILVKYNAIINYKEKTLTLSN